MSEMLHKAEEAVTGHSRVSTSNPNTHDTELLQSDQANKLDPTVERIRDQPNKATQTNISPNDGKTAGDTNMPYPQDKTTDGTTSAHDTEVARQAQQQMVPDKEHRTRGLKPWPHKQDTLVGQ
ncbi:uncharacterized protein N7459_001597 [Penicillium hispanicum]|uniref:uncharacterized protein n=1 Tax=Penicillium hispanicum TaxID=1080232 RepID=UPI002541C979|nr:uncharacterized protein N7459_001597 [Penicillium hispanicum]KAJ5595389.1 hypothetical protein N7459_001597 [Penicillium hispanicum]